MTSNFDTIQSIHSNVRYLGEEIHFDLIFKCFSVDNINAHSKDGGEDRNILYYVQMMISMKRYFIITTLTPLHASNHWR